MLAALGLLFVCADAASICTCSRAITCMIPPIFGDGQSRACPFRAVPRGDLTLGPRELLYTGKVNGQPSRRSHIPSGNRECVASATTYSAAVPRFAYDGDGMIVQRGFRHPPSFHEDRTGNSGSGIMT